MSKPMQNRTDVCANLVMLGSLFYLELHFYHYCINAQFGLFGWNAKFNKFQNEIFLNTIRL